MAIRFHSFRARILVFVLGLLASVLGVVLYAVNTANEREARRHIDEALTLTAGAFRRSLLARERILLEKARLLSSDFAFKQAAATRDHPTLLSALENHRARVAAAVMMLLELDGTVIADTLHPTAHGDATSLMRLRDAAMTSEHGDAASIESLDDRYYQLVMVPLFTPEPTAWIVIGFAMGDDFALELQRETRTHVTLLTETRDGWIPFSSTLTRDRLEALGEGRLDEVDGGDANITLELGGEVFVTAVQHVSVEPARPVLALLQRSLPEALHPYLRLRQTLLGVFAVGLGLSVVGGALLATRVTKPVQQLAEGARRVAEGEYERPVEVAQRDELGVLANAFNDMMVGLAERDRVRNLLGKVVSPEIAEELLRKDIELGGEERCVSVLFTDIRDFTTLSESESPQGVVRMLNTYLTRVSDIIEKHGGVVDKYVGDAVMALFGAPIDRDDDAVRAVRAAMELCTAMREINAEIAATKDLHFGFGVGIHTGTVVAGNMGSPSRLNYTVIGDGVNVASRLEGLTKYYRVGAIVSETTREACPEILWRELDLVRVKGRRTPLAIYEPLGARATVEPPIVREAEQFHRALGHFRRGDWSSALAILEELACAVPDSALYQLYLARTRRMQADPPGPDWDGVATFETK